MKKLIGTMVLGAMLGLPLATARVASAGEETTVTKKTTTTGPSGTVVIENESSRTFKLQGEARTFVAPPDVDLHGLSGKEVTVTVDPNGNVTKVVRKTTTY